MKDTDELKFDFKSSKDKKMFVLKVEAPHEMNVQDLIWCLAWYSEELQREEDARYNRTMAAQGN
jgi:hypothetical protein